jgi:hypothetical protein
METEDTKDELRYEIRPDWPQRKAALTAEVKSEIVDACTTLSLGEYRMQERYDLTVKELADLLLDFDVERCPSCRLHTDSHALFDNDGTIDGHCNNCRNYKK